MSVREADEYGRLKFGPSEIPPPDVRFAHWRGRDH